ncbi:NUDIX hydrolase [Paenibacillus nasutitermitis]|uniref:DNA mismatch repair protein MutT n=1 Tax=Paenibacillus nasutitermitis TaxID=1652958 RepID=A0A916Z6Q7_9BACL|nr:NUDIX hydrolase [Paenibacillus nasutitermitis]GGD78658.1 DNA mismatch repair protein MutT [Paenibacillus nasutitermitis]
MIAQAIVIQDNQVLMVRQAVQRGDIVWNFPGGGIEDHESPEQACIRELYEETGYNVRITGLLHVENEKYTYIAEIIGGGLFLDTTKDWNQDIIELAWIDLNDREKFDGITTPMLMLYLQETNDQPSHIPNQDSADLP